MEFVKISKIETFEIIYIESCKYILNNNYITMMQYNKTITLNKMAKCKMIGMYGKCFVNIFIFENESF